eukprot:4277519-Pyramimonas_sp.AAC.1
MEEAVTAHQENVAKNRNDYIWRGDRSYAAPKNQVRWCWEYEEQTNWKMISNFSRRSGRRSDARPPAFGTRTASGTRAARGNTAATIFSPPTRRVRTPTL